MRVALVVVALAMLAVGGLAQSTSGRLFSRESFLEAQASTGRRKLDDKKFSGAAARISEEDSRCVICQYLVQRIRGEMLMNGIGGNVPFGQTPPMVGAKDPIDNSPSNVFSPPPASGGVKLANGAPNTDTGAFNTNAGGNTGGETNANGDGQNAENTDGNTGGSFIQVDEERGIFDKVRGMTKSIKGRFNRFFKGPLVWKSSKRDRMLDMLKYRPTQSRYANVYDGPLRAMHRAQERWENNQMYSIVFQVIEDICSKHMPKPYYKYCGYVMAQYQTVAEGLRWKDRADAICITLDFCAKASYIQAGPHATFRDY